MDLLTKKQPKLNVGQRVIWMLTIDPIVGTAVPLMGKLNKIAGSVAEVELTGDFLDPYNGHNYPKGFIAKPLVDQIKLAD